jgi:NAD(P)-dependent dehydrogenase (short-subunit alcohol dehydrogenase family)
MLLEAKTVIVAGAGPGLGREIALLFAEHGANLVLGARRLERLEAVVDEIRAAGGRAEGVQLDVTDPDACRAAVDHAVTTYGGLDILVNNAYDTGDFARFEDADLAAWRRTMDINLWGTLQMTRAAVPELTARPEEGGSRLSGGRVIMVNSLSAWRPKANFGAYTIAKAALETATRQLAVELGPAGIRVNGIHPGYIWGDSVELYFKIQAEQRGITPEEVYDEVAGETALGYLPSGAEVAGPVLFLASDLAGPVTGESLGVTCGHQV